jgi:hypothetical protein
MDEFKDTNNNIIYGGGTPVFICQDCGLKYTHYDNHMLILKDHVWNLIANKEDVLCDHCIEIRLKRRLKINDLGRNTQGDIFPLNNWFIEYLKSALADNKPTNICKDCHKPKRMEIGILQLLCECPN